MRLSGSGCLINLTPTGKIRWRTPLEETISAGLSLADGSTILSGSRHIYRIDVAGRLLCRTPDLGRLEDSGGSVNLGWDSEILMAGLEGELWCLQGRYALALVRQIGYDVLPPALYPDGTFGLACYCGLGAQRVDRRGRFLWDALKITGEVDGVPVLNEAGDLAVSSLNAKETVVLDSQGRLLFRIAGAGSCSVHPLGWVVQDRRRVRLVDRTGAVLWCRGIEAPRLNWGLRQVVVDKAGFLYVPSRRGVVALSPLGEFLFTLDLSEFPPENLALVAPGLLGFVLDRTLFLVE